MNHRLGNHVPGVLNVGSLNIDRVFRLPHVTRPGETLASSALDVFAGGKGANQSVALARAGAKVSHCGRVGPDGAWLVDKLAAEGVDTRSVKQGDSPSGQAIIQVGDDGQNAIVLLAGANHQITNADIDAALAGCAPGTLVLTQNETSGVAHLIERAAAAGLPVAFNPAPFTPAVLDYPLDRVAILIVNELEGEGLTGSNKPEDILSRLRPRLTETEIILTLGANGVLYDDGRERLRVPALAVDAVDTTAAGDTFIGYFLAQRLRGSGVKTSLETACRAAAISVSRPGATDSIPFRRELADFEPRRKG